MAKGFFAVCETGLARWPKYAEMLAQKFQYLSQAVNILPTFEPKVTRKLA